MNVVAVSLHLGGKRGAGADERHLSSDNVRQLRKFVK
jgi:hypothetical protein